jgi:putative ABC transport system substrate-binding protein
MRRREFITLLGSVTASSSLSWPLAVHAQQAERMRRIGILTGIAGESRQRYFACRTAT